jgi:hypothetical protein
MDLLVKKILNIGQIEETTDLLNFHLELQLMKHIKITLYSFQEEDGVSNMM